MPADLASVKIGGKRVDQSKGLPTALDLMTLIASACGEIGAVKLNLSLAYWASFLHIV